MPEPTLSEISAKLEAGFSAVGTRFDKLERIGEGAASAFAQEMHRHLYGRCTRQHGLQE